MLSRALPTIVGPKSATETLGLGEQGTTEQEGLGVLVKQYLELYLETHKDHLPEGQLYALVLGEVEKPLLEVTLKLFSGNQKKSADVLGINRNTLRKKMIEYQLITPNDESI